MDSGWQDSLASIRAVLFVYRPHTTHNHSTLILLHGNQMSKSVPLLHLVLQVILILTKYYHADSTKVLESSLWR